MAEIYESQVNLSAVQEADIDTNEIFEFVDEYLRKPSSVWKEAKLDKKLKLQWFQFPQGVVFDGKDYGTAQTASIFKTKEAFLPPQSPVVDPRRFELLTFALQKHCSTS